ncbi:MAG: HAMP domain-containing sensor histidine kinase [Eubacterium sp.]
MKLKNTSIKWKLFGYIALFAAAMIFIIWLFQIVFLDNFYKCTKIEELRSLSKTISENIDNQDLSALVSQIGGRNNICAKILNTSGNVEINVDTSPNCALHHLSNQELIQLYLKAEQNGGTFLDVFVREPIKTFNITNQNKIQSNGILPEQSFVQAQDENIIYTEVITDSSGNQFVVMLNTLISPVNATVQTLRSQLFYITLIFLVLALVFAFIISKRISKPIIKINDTAKELAKGNVEVQFEGEGYQEITELNDTLNYAAEELSKVEKLRKELIANISHDLRTPLTMITGYAEVMRDIPGENTPENVQIIIDEANRLATLVTDVLDISKLQSGIQQLSTAPYDLTVDIREILARYNKLKEQGGYTIIFEADQDVFVEADEMKMSQVIYNLVNNAINYAGDDKTVIIRQTLHKDVVKIEVIDHGEGISKAFLPYVWDRYYKIDKTHKQASVGTGLGLSIVKNILELHHLRFGVESTQGEGSTFWFEIPRIKEDA